MLCENPDETVTARAARCGHCCAALADADQTPHARYDKIETPKVKPVVTRVERYAGRCRCRGTTTLATVPDGFEQGSPFSINIAALATYLRFVHAISYRRLTRLLLDLYGLCISEGALDASFHRGKPRLNAAVAGILTRLRRSRVVCSDETSVRVDGRRLRKRYIKVREHLLTFLAYPEATADNNGSERELRPTATYRKVTGGF